jgi:hypothetical protein
LAEIGFQDIGESGLGVGILTFFIIVICGLIGIVLAIVGFIEKENKLLLMIGAFLNTFCFFGFWTFGWIIRALDSIFRERIW